MNNAQLKDEAKKHQAAGMKAYQILCVYTNLLKLAIRECGGRITVPHDNLENQRLVIQQDSKNKRSTLTLEEVKE